jgi:transcriptional regulator with XRE-family HTH domain
MKKNSTKEKTDDRTDFAKFVSAYRQLYGLTQQELADKIGLAKTGVALAESDRFDLPIGFFRKLYPHLGAAERAAVLKMFMKKIEMELKNENG